MLWCLGSLFAQSPMGGVIPYNPQNTELLDTAEYRFDYELKFMANQKKKISLDNWHCLLIGKKYIKYANQHNYDDTAEIIKQYKARRIRHQEGRGLGGTEVYHSLENGRLSITTQLFGIGTFAYDEEQPKLSWTINPNESKELLGYKCQKATCHFRGRDYIAWFTPDLPLPYGPYKFGALSGLILELYDKDDIYHFYYRGIKQGKFPIYRYKAKSQSTSRKKYLRLLKRMHQDMGAIFVAKGVNIVGNNEKPLVGGSIPPFPYNAIELE